MIVSEIKLFELLKAKIGEKEAEAFVQILETRVDKKFEDAKATLATKEDLATKIGELEIKMSQMEARLTMRMFYFWLGQVAVIAGLLAYFFNLHK